MTAPLDRPLRIVLVDDQPLVRAGFSMVIDSQDDMSVVAQAADGAAAVEELRARTVDVVLMDVRMPRMDGIEATSRILAQAPEGRAPKIIVLTTFDLDEYVVSAIRAGASGFLLKDAQPEELLAAIRTVHSGDAVIAPSATRRLLARVVATPEPQEKDTSMLEALTEREREVLTLMGRGYSNQEIGAELFVAEATVKTHVGRVLSKLGARDRVQAVIIAFETGLVSPGAE
ncbi:MULTISPECIES: response regulator [Brachybacterium]|uniref:DNA-binding response regulator n=1 Tax=Brachybacterium alimentarium TaxID=47845 RepID=A0A2A3YIV6_9MICO|nr:MULTISPECIES: response regulator transcription factor [Brachybacterium]PCC35705.1 DNA-binding response regulator [Brachybacterium alimentarium]PCC39233.1 DNA-binding response regulator [Brachybacterium alimentarium]RCS64375.1 DNA-binding response regulator [Brachybacterium sp. JB7]RCS66514.1 DNA-binding response regulator [Brachybacterium alimentarium]RCS67915.1 DNA-binding response regulator [Brachybacterium alimentarium]